MTKTQAKQLLLKALNEELSMEEQNSLRAAFEALLVWELP